MSYITERYDIDNSQNHAISVVQCGWQRCDSGHHLGPALFEHYSITFVLSGCGYYTVNNQTYKIHEGEGFVIFPGTSVYYIADSESPWEYRFAVFKGTDAQLLLNSAGVRPDNPIFSYQKDATMESWLQLMCQASASGAAQGYDVQGYFLLCMSRLVARHWQENAAFTTHEQIISQALSYMKTNYAYDISIQNVAGYIGVERSYLYRLFMQELGCSPQSWLINYRLEQGARMLTQTDHSIAEIACSIGFFDASHFSRSFRKLYSDAPFTYRKKHRASSAKPFFREPAETTCP